MNKSKINLFITSCTNRQVPLKTLSLFIMILLFSSVSAAQVSLRGSMGILFQSMPSVRDYLNLYSNNNPDFTSAVVFSVEGGYRTSEKTEAGLEVAYLINSQSLNYDYGQYDFSYSIIMPTLYYYYVLNGNGYNFKFGAGAGPRLLRLEEKLPATDAVVYTSTGYGFALKVDGNTLIGGNFYANIGADLKYDINGEPKGGGRNLYNNIFDENVNFNSFSVGVRLGITFQF